MDEPRVYKKASGTAITFLILHVDDILIIGNVVSMVTLVKFGCLKLSVWKILEKQPIFLEFKYTEIDRKD